VLSGVTLGLANGAEFAANVSASDFIGSGIDLSKATFTRIDSGLVSFTGIAGLSADASDRGIFLKPSALGKLWTAGTAAADDFYANEHRDIQASIVPLANENGIIIRLDDAEFKPGFIQFSDFEFTSSSAPNIASLKSGVYTRISDSQVMITGLDLAAQSITVKVLAESLASQDTPPALSGANKVPQLYGVKDQQNLVITSVVMSADPLVDTSTITVTFSSATSKPAVATKANIDALFTFTATDGTTSRVLGDDYTGAWNAQGNVLTITIVDDANTTFVATDKVLLKPNTVLNPASPGATVE
jgi:hypothetical protein